MTRKVQILDYRDDAKVVQHVLSEGIQVLRDVTNTLPV